VQSERFRYRGVKRQEFFMTVKEVFMLIMKEGVSIGGIRTECLFGILIVLKCFEDFGQTMVITSVTDGKHGSLSYHPAGLAFDIRLPPDRFKEEIPQRIRERLGPEFDVIVEETHIHVEYEIRRIHR